MWVMPYNGTIAEGDLKALVLYKDVFWETSAGNFRSIFVRIAIERWQQTRIEVLPVTLSAAPPTSGQAEYTGVDLLTR
jgi:hypothetical protein